MSRIISAKRAISSIAFGIFFAMLGCSLVSHNSYALIDSQTIRGKNDAYNLYQCINQGQFQNNVRSDNYYKSSFVSSDYNNLFSVSLTNDNLASNTIGNTTCSELVNERFSSKLPETGASVQELDKFFSDIGYTVKSSSDAGRCATFNFKSEKSGSSSATLCASGVNKNNGKIPDDAKLTFKTTGNSPLKFSEYGSDLKIGNLDMIDVRGKDFNEIVSYIESRTNSATSGNAIGWSGWSVDGAPQYTASSQEYKTYVYNNTPANANKAIAYFTGYENIGNARLTDEEQADLLASYLKDFYAIDYYRGSEQKGCDLDASAARDAESVGYKGVKLGSKTCYVIPTKNQNAKVAGFSSSGFIDGAEGSEMGFDQVASRLGAVSTRLPNEGGNNPSLGDMGMDTSTDADGNTTSGESGEGSDTTPVCYSAANALGWVICPVVQAIGTAIESLYEWIIAPFVPISASMLDRNGGNESLYSAWNIFRQIANILFAIAFAFVIFAQITGIGMNNYNIKKTLPRLLAVVILVNVSFLLMQVAVDLSNIFGNGLQNMLTNLASQVGVAEENFTVGGIVKQGVTSLLTIGAGAGTVAGLAVTWDLWLIPFVLTIISVVVGLVFFFVILAVRQAVAILLIAIAPAAIVCYALPNTKSAFDKWLKAFEAVILVYPICGALIGGGKFASALLVNAGAEADQGFIYMIMALIVSIIPFFMVPSIVKRSMASIGNIGAKISMAGQKFSRRAGGALLATEAGKELQRNIALKGGEMRYNRMKKKIGGEEGWKNASNSQRRRLAKAKSQYNAMRAEDARLESGEMPQLMTPGGELWNREVSNAQKASLKNDVAGQEALYEAGQVEIADRSTDANHQVRKINFNNMQDLKDEYQALLKRVDADPNDYNSRVRLRAVQNQLMKSGKGQDTLSDGLREYLASRKINPATGAAEGNSVAGDLAQDESTAKHQGFAEAMAHLNAEHRGTLHTKDRGLEEMVNDAVATPNNFAKNFQFATDVNGNADYAQLKSGADLGFKGYDEQSKYSASDLANANDKALERLLNVMRSGTMSSTQMKGLAANAASALDNPRNNNMSNDVRAQLQKMVATGMTAGAMQRTTSNLSDETDGSKLAGNIGLETLKSVADQIDQTEKNGTYVLTDDEVRKMAENSRRFLESGSQTMDVGIAEQHQAILAAAKKRGIKDMSGHDFNQVDASTIKIRGAREAPKPMVIDPVPEGYTEDGRWTNLLRAETPQDKIKYDEWVRHKAQAERHNRNLNP